MILDISNNDVKHIIGGLVSKNHFELESGYRSAKAFKKGLDYQKENSSQIKHAPFSTNILHNSNHDLQISKDVFNLASVLKQRVYEQMEDPTLSAMPFILLGDLEGGVYKIRDAITPIGQLCEIAQKKGNREIFYDKIISRPLSQEEQNNFQSIALQVANEQEYDIIINGSTHAPTGDKPQDILAANCHTFGEIASLIELSEQVNDSVMGSAVINSAGDLNIIVSEPLNNINRNEVLRFPTTKVEGYGTIVPSYTDNTQILDNHAIITKPEKDELDNLFQLTSMEN